MPEPCHGYFTAYFVSLLFGISVTGISAAELNDAKTPVIQEIKIKPRGFRLPGFRRTKPAIARTVAELKKILGKEEGAAVAKQVDFDKQYCVLFAWAGSGRDRLTYKVTYEKVDGDKKPSIRFEFRAGLTRDLRGHTHFYGFAKVLLTKSLN